MERKSFAEGMAIISACIPGIEIKEQLLDAWYTLLRDLSDEEFSGAVLKVCNEKHCYPGTNLVALIRECSKPDPQNSHTQAILAWQQVIEAVERVGIYQSVIFSDPVIHSCIKALGGWVELGLTLREELIWKEKKFLELYPIYARMSCHPRKLAGITEITNHAESFPREIPEPVKIGFGNDIKALEK